MQLACAAQPAGYPRPRIPGRAISGGLRVTLEDGQLLAFFAPVFALSLGSFLTRLVPFPSGAGSGAPEQDGELQIVEALSPGDTYQKEN